METGQKVFLLVFLSVGILFIYVVFIHPSDDDSDSYNSDFQLGDLGAGNETVQQEQPPEDVQNVTSNNVEDQQNAGGELRPNIPYRVVLPGRNPNRNFNPKAGYRQQYNQNKNADGTLDQEVPNDQNQGGESNIPPVDTNIPQNGNIPQGEGDMPQGDGNIPQGEGDVPQGDIPQGEGRQQPQLLPAPVADSNQNGLNQEGNEEDDDRDRK